MSVTRERQRLHSHAEHGNEEIQDAAAQNARYGMAKNMHSHGGPLEREDLQFGNEKKFGNEKTWE